MNPTIELQLELSLGKSDDTQVQFIAKRGLTAELAISMTHTHWKNLGNPTKIYATVEAAS